MIRGLTKDGIYSCVGVVNDRPDNRGGLFEVYKSETNDKNRKADAVNSVLKYENFLFIATGRQNLNYSILQKTNRDRNEFNKRRYLIREKNTLRIANSEEEDILRRAEQARELSERIGKLSINSGNTSFSSDHGDARWEKMIKKIMHNSYGRMAMAYQRSRDRYDKLVRAYNEIFDFEIRKLTKEEQIIITTYRGETKNYRKFYNVTLKDNYGQNLSLKKIFEILQVYNSTDENPYPDSEDDIINGYRPLVVNLNIGGKIRQFILSEWPSKMSEYQILISTRIAHHDNAETHYTGKQYGSLVQGFDSDTAEIMIECLNASARATPEDFPENNLNDDDWLRIVEFLALTQIAESNHGKRDYNNSRTPGMNKLARQLLRLIADEYATFDETFISDINSKKSYPPIGYHGMVRARYAVCQTSRNTIVKKYNQKKKQYDDIHITVGRCCELSEDSDTD